MPTVEHAPLLELKMPYPGLRPFEADEAFLFYGRKSHTEELLRRLATNRFLAVVGTSGSGKSSLVRAGLLPALYRGFLAGGASQWRIAVMKPGDAPMANLTKALWDQRVPLGELSRSSLGLVQAVRQGAFAPGEGLLIVVDQFEELFRFRQEQTDGGAEANLFVMSLLEAADSFSAPIYVVLTMRSDFLGDCTQFRGLAEAMNRSQYLIPRLTREQRREAIEKPVRLVNTEMTPRLVQRLLNELGDDPDQLTVLQHALNRTFQKWKKSGAVADIDFAHYEAAKTLEGALNDHAGALLTELPKAARSWVERLFRCLTTTLPGGRAVRRAARLDQIYGVLGIADEGSRALVCTVIEKFAHKDNSLLVCSPPGELRPESVIDISHESLIARWSELKRWVDEEAEAVRWYGSAAEDAQRHRRGEAGTWRDPELKRALALAESGPWNEAWTRRNFPDCGIAYEDVRNFLKRGAAEQRAEKRRARVWLIATVTLLLIALVSLALLVRERGREIDLQRRLIGLDAQLHHKEGEKNDIEKQLKQAGLSASEKTELQSKLDAVSGDLKRIEEQKTQAEKKVQAGEAQANNLVSERTGMQEQISGLKADLKNTQNERDALKLKLDAIQQPDQQQKIQSDRDQVKEKQNQVLIQQLMETTEKQNQLIQQQDQQQKTESDRDQVKEKQNQVLNQLPNQQLLIQELNKQQTQQQKKPVSSRSVLTQGNNSMRTGAYLLETQLTPTTVATGMQLLYSRPVNGILAGQLLYAHGVKINSKPRNVIYAFTSQNTVYAYDADEERDSGTNRGLIWSRLLPVTPSPRLFPAPDGGIRSTPVIDESSGKLYLVYPISNGLFPPGGKGDGSPLYEVEYHLAALDLSSGNVLQDRVVSGSVPSNVPPGLVDFVPRRQTQGAGLLLLRNPLRDHERTIYVAFGGRWLENTHNYHGWLMGYDAKTLAPRGVFCSTPDRREPDEGGGIGDLAGDENGNVYFNTGKGPVSGNDYGNSIVKLTPVLRGGNYDFSVQPFSATPDEQHLNGAWTYWAVSPTGGYIFHWADRDFLRRFDYDPTTGQINPASMVTGDVLAKPYPVHGGLISLSANDTMDGLLWATLPWDGGKGRIMAFDALTLRRVWDTTAPSGAAVSHNGPPTLAAGKVIVGTINGNFLVYGLTRAPAAAPTAHASATPRVASQAFASRERILPMVPDPTPRILEQLGRLAPDKTAVLTPPKGHRPLFIATGKGSLTYEVKRVDTAASLQWVLVEVSGELRDDTGVVGFGQVLATAQPGLAWKTAEGGIVHWTIETSVSAPQAPDAAEAHDAPWILFRSAPSDGHDLLEQVTYVQLLGTVGGEPPGRVGQMGERLQVSYTGTYVLYVGDHAMERHEYPARSKNFV
jgi:hypothetical protein